MIAFRQLVRFLSTGQRHRPDRGLIPFFLFVDGDAHKGDTRTVGRDLQIADPNKVEQIFFGDVAFLCESRADSGEKDNQVCYDPAHKGEMTKHPPSPGYGAASE